MTKFKISIFKVQGGPIVLLIYLFLTRYLEGFFYLILKYRLLKGKEDLARFHERKGIVKLKRPKGQLVWFNAASVGEVLSIFPLMPPKSSLTAFSFSSYSLLACSILLAYV